MCLQWYCSIAKVMDLCENSIAALIYAHTCTYLHVRAGYLLGDAQCKRAVWNVLFSFNYFTINITSNVIEIKHCAVCASHKSHAEQIKHAKNVTVVTRKVMCTGTQTCNWCFVNYCMSLVKRKFNNVVINYIAHNKIYEILWFQCQWQCILRT